MFGRVESKCPYAWPNILVPEPQNTLTLNPHMGVSINRGPVGTPTRDP